MRPFLSLAFCLPMAALQGPQAGILDVDFQQVKIVRQPPAPPYPPEAKLNGVQGTVQVEVTVGADGIPVVAQAKQGPALLRHAAESFAMGWRFAPFLVNGRAVTVRFQMVMPFRLSSQRSARCVQVSVDLDSPVSLDVPVLRAAAAAEVQRLGLALAGTRPSDPGNDLVANLTVRVRRLAPGLLSLEAVLRGSRVADALAEEDPPADPPRVWRYRQVLALRGEAGLAAQAESMVRDLVRSHVLPPSPNDDHFMRYAAGSPSPSTYTSARVLDPPGPQALPAGFKAANGKAAVDLLVSLDANGKVIQIQSSNGPKDLEAAAFVQAFACHYAPATRGGSPVPGLCIVQVRFVQPQPRP